MNTSKIYKLQKQYRLHKYQKMINNGDAWRSSREIGEKCKSLLESGACLLPTVEQRINIFSVVPSRYQVAKGGVGSLEHSRKYWSDTWNMSVLLGNEFQSKYVETYL